MTNKQYAQRAEAALAAYPNCEENDLSESIVDLMTDLLHLAHQHDIEPDYVIHTATMHFDTEVKEEAVLA